MLRETHAKSILIKRKRIDSWFMTHYGMNLYRGCGHNCVYCDGRAEAYRVEGDFGEDVTVKINAIDVLERELDPSRKRKPMPIRNLSSEELMCIKGVGPATFDVVQEILETGTCALYGSLL